jgi:O-6-methylguanine DNA methyltransferase
MIYSKIIATPIGSMLACSVDEGICLLEFSDNQNFEFELKKLAEELTDTISEHSCNVIELLEKQLCEYFEGKRKNFTIPLHLIGTDFQKRVWNTLLDINFGKTISYKEQALALGDIKAIRAVASANGANRIPIVIPCHRVVGSNGKLTGYSGRVWHKEFLLDFENRQYIINL